MITETWVCILMLFVSFFVNFFVKTFILWFVNVFLCIFLITVTDQNEWLLWVGAILIAYCGIMGMWKLYEEIFR
jgi:hypothetical protein